MIDYILLILLALEYLYFGLLGLIDPASTSALVAFTLNETIHSVNSEHSTASSHLLAFCLSLPFLKKVSD